MVDEPQTWHFGLVARWWAEFNEPDPDELAFYQRFIEQAGQPALDLACGTGRLLLPLLAAGLDVDGCDGSADMLDYARERTRREGFAPGLFKQSMHQLDLPRTYGSIFICDSFGIGASHEEDAEALKRCYRHLAPGGMLAFSHHLPYHEVDSWPFWLPGSRPALPLPWEPIEERKTAKNGDEIGLTSRLAEFDPLRQFVVIEIRAELRREGQLIREEHGAIRINLGFACEMLQMLASAGFVDAEVRAGYSDLPATADDTFVVFVARKPLDGD